MDQKHQEKSKNKVNKTEMSDCGSCGIFSDQLINEVNPIKPRYINIKEETINIIPIHKWDQTVRKAKIFFECVATHKYKTKSCGVLRDKIFNINTSWKKGEQMSFKETIPVMMYVDFDDIQTVFKTHTTQQLGHLFHLRRTLLIILNKFGDTKYKEELFIAVNSQTNDIISTHLNTIKIYGPLSATSSLTVANILATEKGMVLTITPAFCNANYCRIFNASLISAYPEEAEWIIGLVYLRVVDIKICRIKERPSIESQDNDSLSLSVNKI